MITPRTRTSRLLKYAVLVVLTLVFVSPLLFMVLTSLKSPQEAVQTPPTWWPDPLTFQAYERILGAPDTPVVRWFLNSLVAATANAALVVTTSALAAYALARLEFRGKKVISALIISTLFVPPVILVVPNYEIVGRLFWLDTLLAIIVPTAAGAFGVFFLRQFFIGLPKELEESAYLDGASRWQVFTRIVLPLSKPALASLALLTFVNTWNDYMGPFIYLTDNNLWTVQLGLRSFVGLYDAEYAMIMTGSVLSVLPILVIFLLGQKYFVQGIATSGMK